MVVLSNHFLFFFLMFYMGTCLMCFVHPLIIGAHLRLDSSPI